MTRPTLLIFTKAPRIGASKTRLASDIGRTEARRMSRRLTAHTISQSEHPAWHTRLMVDPPSLVSATLGGLWPAQVERRPQRGRSLGERLANAMADAPPGPVIFIGTDAPGLHRSMIRQAVCNLGRNAAVFGPASDGGFWLFGVSRELRAPSLFEDVRWSSPHAMEDVWSNLPQETRITLLRQLTDIDTWRDWQLYKQSQ
ncbi:glycosyltransferase [Henriciella barbarensis]|uniref:Glycosyltransferase n=1 Tax=Henriciella barbarensis TaxID=86342 RepID=A0A399R8B7_9PROT|nr:glycosyltransferase [Henriciella barbarensis]